jgi:hypothetical protein
MIAYKLFRLKKDNTIGSLFINRNGLIPINQWLDAEFTPRKGFAPRKGWHCTFTQNAPHLKMKLSNGEQRVWAKVEVEDWISYDRPKSQGGSWILANKMKVIEVYR